MPAVGRRAAVNGPLVGSVPVEALSAESAVGRRAAVSGPSVAALSAVGGRRAAVHWPSVPAQALSVALAAVWPSASAQVEAPLVVPFAERREAARVRLEPGGRSRRRAVCRPMTGRLEDASRPVVGSRWCCGVLWAAVVVAPPTKQLCGGCPDPTAGSGSRLSAIAEVLESERVSRRRSETDLPRENS